MKKIFTLFGVIIAACMISHAARADAPVIDSIQDTTPSAFEYHQCSRLMQMKKAETSREIPDDLFDELCYWADGCKDSAFTRDEYYFWKNIALKCEEKEDAIINTFYIHGFTATPTPITIDANKLSGGTVIDFSEYVGDEETDTDDEESDTKDLLGKKADMIKELSEKVLELQKDEESDTKDLLEQKADMIKELSEKLLELQKDEESETKDLLGKKADMIKELSEKLLELQKPDKNICNGLKKKAETSREITDDLFDELCESADVCIDLAFARDEYYFWKKMVQQCNR